VLERWARRPRQVPRRKEQRPRRPRPPWAAAGVTGAGSDAATPEGRQADDDCLREVASARAALPPRSPWTKLSSGRAPDKAAPNWGTASRPRCAAAVRVRDCVRSRPPARNPPSRTAAMARPFGDQRRMIGVVAVRRTTPTRRTVGRRRPVSVPAYRPSPPVHTSRRPSTERSVPAAGSNVYEPVRTARAPLPSGRINHNCWPRSSARVNMILSALADDAAPNSPTTRSGTTTADATRTMPPTLPR
jgi:hypothetical protein